MARSNDYTDVELRMKALPLAVDLVNTEVQRVLGKCNTNAIAEITGELVNVMLYGSVTKPDVTEAEVVDVTPTVKFA